MIEGNASTASPASHLRASATLFNHFVKIPSSFCDSLTAGPPPTPKAPAIGSAIVEMVTERQVSIDIIVIIVILLLTDQVMNFFYKRRFIIKDLVNCLFAPCNLHLKIFPIFQALLVTYYSNCLQ